MAFCRLHDEYWAVNLESLGLDTPKLASHVLFKSTAYFSINSIFYCHKPLDGPPFWTGAMVRIPVTLIVIILFILKLSGIIIFT